MWRQELANAIKSGVGESDAVTPSTVTEAMSMDDDKQWWQSMVKEYETIESMGTWTKVKRSTLAHGTNVIKSKWVFKYKHNEFGVVTERKARLTPKGFMQKEGKDYFDVFAQTGQYKSLRVLLSVVASNDYELEQMDVPSAFCNASLEENVHVFMEMPEGFEEDGYVLMLNKALYGLKQGPRQWWLMISKFIVEKMGYTQCASDRCLFVKQSKTGKPMYMYLFVDDFQAAYRASDRAEFDVIRQMLVDEYRTKVLGPSRWMLGMRITRDRVRRTITLDQERHVIKALEKFRFHESKAEDTPGEPNIEQLVSPTGVLDEPTDRVWYMEVVGSLIYIATSTRPDISHAVHMVCKHMQVPLYRHRLMVERILRYLNGTRSLGLLFGRNTSGDDQRGMSIEAYCDADWANDTAERKSVTGWITKLNGDVISWASKKQNNVALSTCEAELYAEVEAFKEVMWLRDLMMELGIHTQPTSLVYCDNRATVTVSKNGVKNGRTKHVDLRNHFVVQTIESGNIETQWIATTEQQADALTKPLSRNIFIRLRDLIMTSIPSSSSSVT